MRPSGNTADVKTYVEQWHHLIDLLGKRCSPGNTLKKKKCQLSYQFGYIYRIDWRIDPCENPRTGASHAQTRNVPIIG